jgi:hypothetical protein
MKALYAWLLAEEVVTRNPFSKISLKVPEEARETPDDDTIDAMIEHARGAKQNALRDVALLTALADTGARKTEIGSPPVERRRHPIGHDHHSRVEDASASGAAQRPRRQGATPLDASTRHEARAAVERHRHRRRRVAGSLRRRTTLQGQTHAALSAPGVRSSLARQGRQRERTDARVRLVELRNDQGVYPHKS